MRRSVMCALLALAVAPAARAAEYTASVLYPVAIPSGFSTIYPQSVTSEAVAGYGVLSGTNAPSHALLWSWPAGSATDLTPTQFGDISSSQLKAAFGGQQVGSFGGAATDNLSHAALWSGTAASAVDLQPTLLPGILSSAAAGTDGTQQVGYGRFGTATSSSKHALLWTGTADSAVDLNPTVAGATVASVALGVAGGQEVGDSGSNTSPLHAVLWTGTAASAVDLHPSDPSFITSVAVATSGTQQVGQASDGAPKAFLSYGTAASAVNLNPINLSGINASVAVATNGLQQVGWGYDASVATDTDQALVWSGSPDSAVDLQSALPATGTWNYSGARSIDPAGNIFGTANGTYGGVSGDFAVEWSPVPEPSSPLLLGAGALVFLRPRGRNTARRR